MHGPHPPGWGSHEGEGVSVELAVTQPGAGVCLLPSKGAVDPGAGYDQIGAARHGIGMEDSSRIDVHAYVGSPGPQQLEQLSASHAVPEARDTHLVAALHHDHLVGPGVRVLEDQPPGLGVVGVELT